ncbi:MAG TPA: MmgE/PrpD family protein [Burkholderiales bacterium]|jgi:2-methylcitrate dehydratase PrpD|nr:MmgE/PrpD family protein [Burkholderiales bacterium]
MTDESTGSDESLTACVARFTATTRYDDIPANVLRSAKKAILDTIGVALAGAQAEASVVLRRYIEGLGCNGAGAVTVFGSALRALPRFAALANATAMHADDFDDSFPSRLHSSSPVLAAVFAEAERADASGRDLLAAFCVGTEVTCKVVQTMNPEHYARGYHATSTCGVFGATAGVCNLHRMSPEATAAALGIAGSEAAGLRENFGTMVKPLHAGRAAESALVAVSLIELGFTATHTILEGPRGFFTAGGGSYDGNVMRGKFGNPWCYLIPGIAIKPFPSGWLTHPAMCELRALILKHDIRPEQVDRLAVKTNRVLPLNLTYHQPKTGLQGKFSMEFCLAAIMVLRQAGLSEFSDEVVNRSDIREFLGKIDYSVYSDAEAAAERYTLLTTFLDITFKDGRRFTLRVDAAKGSPEFPMDEDEVAQKVRECAQFSGWAGSRTEKLIEQILRLEQVDDVRSIAGLLRSDL